VCAAIEHFEHVREHQKHHRVGRPAVQVAQKNPGSHNKLQVLHVRVSLRHRRMVIEHQQNAGGNQDKKSTERQRAQIPGGAELQGARPDFHREQMKEDILLDGLGAMQVTGAAAAAKYGAPDLSVPEPIEFRFEGGSHAYTFTYSGSFSVVERSTIRLPSSASQ